MCRYFIWSACDNHIVKTGRSIALTRRARGRQTEECVEAHTNVDVVVDLAQFRALLESRLPLVFGGASVADAALPWPDVAAEGEGQEAEDVQ